MKEPNENIKMKTLDDTCKDADDEPSRDEKVDILAFGAHPDDCEIMVGGTLIKMAEKGYRVGIVDLTRGDMGSRGNPEIRAKEAMCASCKLGLSVRKNLNIPDTRVDNSIENRNRVIEIIKLLKPDIVLSPWKGQRHPDHNHTCDLIYEACFFSGLNGTSCLANLIGPGK